MSQDADALAFVKSLGYQAAPVVYTQTEHEYEPGKTTTLIKHWTQFQPDDIKAIVK